MYELFVLQTTQKSYLLSSSTRILANPHVTPHLCLHDKNEQSRVVTTNVYTDTKSLL